MRFLAKLSLLASAALFLASCGKNDTDTVTLKFGHLANEDHIWHKAALHFAEQAAELSSGRVQVQVFPAEQLGKELEMIRSIQSGIIDITVSGESMQNWTPFAAFCGMPYLIKDLEQLRSVADGPAGATIAAEIEKSVGLVPLGYYVRGPRHLTANRPIRTPADLKGIILRVPSVPISIAVWNALGAKATPMAFSEVFTSLQSGAIEAQENPFALINSAGFAEVQSHVNLTSHVVGWVYVLIGKKQLEALPPELQEAVLEAGRRMQTYHQKLFLESEAQLRADLESKGMQMVEVDNAAFQAIAASAVAAEIPEAIRPLYQKIKTNQ
ncbi:TRAP transporter solute receptor, DctP family [Verrucomicrobiia bacterium DG1235]|nr:TRAP transporter solute receptor, DctP family [Verrucomicrobiae bacterium DG1235]